MSASASINTASPIGGAGRGGHTRSEKIMKSAIAVFIAVLIIATGGIAYAVFGQTATFAGLTGTVAQVVVANPTTTWLWVDAGNGPYLIYCYNGVKRGIRGQCGVLKEGDRVLLNGYMLVGGPHKILVNYPLPTCESGEVVTLFATNVHVF